MLPNWKRRLIPKWRDSRITSRLPESLPVFKENTFSYDFFSSDNQNYVLSVLEEWRDNKSIGAAANLLSFGHLAKLHPLIEEPAEYIIECSQHVPSHLLKVANKVLGANQEVSQYENNHDQTKKFYVDASFLKKKIATNPQDAIALVDLARIYSSLGQNKKAERAILTAVNLYPDHRFILRSASRFFIHNNDAEQSLYILNRSGRTKIDPWLMATHISISIMLEKPQKLIKKVKDIIQAKSFPSIHMSELCGSLATLQIIDGNNKEARRNFNKALTSPNDNTIAQAVWMSQHYKMQIATRSEWFVDSLSSEAKYYYCNLLGNFEGALEAALDWQYDEPFSSNPAIASVYTASILEKYEDAEKYARQALILHHDDTNLKDNLVFALAAQNKIEEAESLLKSVMHYEQQHDKISPQSIANLGMILYRNSEFDDGEKMYRTAIELYEKEHDSLRKAIAISYLAREATIAKAPNAESLQAEAMNFVKKVDCKPAEKILSFINGIVINNSAPSLIKPTGWRYDRERNIVITSKNSPFRER